MLLLPKRKITSSPVFENSYVLHFVSRKPNYSMITKEHDFAHQRGLLDFSLHRPYGTHSLLWSFNFENFASSFNNGKNWWLSTPILSNLGLDTKKITFKMNRFKKDQELKITFKIKGFKRDQGLTVNYNI